MSALGLEPKLLYTVEFLTHHRLIYGFAAALGKSSLCMLAIEWFTSGGIYPFCSASSFFP